MVHGARLGDLIWDLIWHLKKSVIGAVVSMLLLTLSLSLSIPRHDGLSEHTHVETSGSKSYDMGKGKKIFFASDALESKCHL